MPQGENAQFLVEELLEKRISRNFSSTCHYTKQGDLLCSYTFQTSRRGGVSEKSMFRVPCSLIEDRNYVLAAATVALDRLLDSIIK